MTQVHLHGQRCLGDEKLLKNIQNDSVIDLDNDTGSERLNQMSDLLNHSYKTYDLELH